MATGYNQNTAHTIKQLQYALNYMTIFKSEVQYMVSIYGFA
jgi:hypothetical protein